MPETNSESEKQELTQQSYKATKYQDQSWEVIGELPEVQVFAPMEIEVLPNTSLRIDPMFADYGGSAQSGPNQASSRWSLPDVNSKNKKNKNKSTEENNEESDEKLFTEGEVSKLVSEAEERGKLQALEEAIALHNEKLSKIEGSMNSILQDLHSQLAENISLTEKYALDLTLAISEKILMHTVDVRPDYIETIINEAIDQCGTASVNRIRVSPQDMEFIQIVGIQKQLKQTDVEWHFDADPSIKAGCVIETSAGEVDFQLDQAFERVKENILKVKK